MAGAAATDTAAARHRQFAGNRPAPMEMNLEGAAWNLDDDEELGQGREGPTQSIQFINSFNSNLEIFAVEHPEHRIMFSVSRPRPHPAVGGDECFPI